MADSLNPTERLISNNIANNTGDEEFTPIEEAEQRVAIYKKVGDGKIPISKYAGPMWKGRRDSALAKLETSGKITNWDEAIRYYKNDQRQGRTGSAAANRERRRDPKGNTEAENVVFANTSALVPAIYAKNPTAEITPNIRDDNKDEGGPDEMLATMSTVGERLINALASKQESPGFNLKPRARKAVVMTTLTNISYLEVGYTKKEDSSEQALMDLSATAEKYENAKSEEEIREAEGELMAIEETISFLRPSGPWVKFKHPKEILRDPDATDADLTNDKFVMSSDFVATAYINAVYREASSSDPKEWKSIYAPTHVASAASKGVDEEINNFTLLKGQTDYRTYGYVDEQSYAKGLRTKVWYVWDKITRRVFMYNDEDWTWPIWVFEDPYNLEGFYPIVPLTFYTDPEDDIGGSEVQYYLDQQDAINSNNREMAKWRNWLKNNIFYNKNVLKDPTVLDKFFEGGENRTALGLDIPPDVDISKVIQAVAPPSINFMQVFSNEPHFQAISRLSSVSPIMQGQQFKTNTTNDAVQTYNSNQQTRLDEKIDAVEDCVGEVFWKVLQMCLQFMPKEQVATVLGPNDAQKWTNMDAATIRSGFSVRVVGGSSQKPTSQVKKQEAIQIGQVLGQYANAGQGVVIVQLLKIMERAFDEIVISTEDWQLIRETLVANVANSNPAGAGGGTPSPEGATPVTDAAGGIEQVLGTLTNIAQAIPPEIQKALGIAMARGVPIEEAIPAIIEELSNAQPAA